MQGKINEKEIKSSRLDTILSNSKFKNKRIDFLNIDVEGGDFEALKSINLDTYKPKLICIEIDEAEISSSNIFKYLVDKNYEKIWSSKSDISHIFVKKN